MESDVLGSGLICGLGRRFGGPFGMLILLGRMIVGLKVRE